MGLVQAAGPGSRLRAGPAQAVAEETAPQARNPWVLSSRVFAQNGVRHPKDPGFKADVGALDEVLGAQGASRCLVFHDPDTPETDRVGDRAIDYHDSQVDQVLPASGVLCISRASVSDMA